jgi:hypothetical protein
MKAVVPVALGFALLFPASATAAAFDYRIDVGVAKAFGAIPLRNPPSIPADALLRARVELGALLGERIFVGPFVEGGVALSCEVNTCIFYRVGAGAVGHLGRREDVHPWVGVFGGFHLLSMAVARPGLVDEYPTAEGGFGQVRAGIDFPTAGGHIVSPVLGGELGAFRFKGLHPQGTVSFSLAFRL